MDIFRRVKKRLGSHRHESGDFVGTIITMTLFIGIVIVMATFLTSTISQQANDIAKVIENPEALDEMNLAKTREAAQKTWGELDVLLANYFISQPTASNLSLERLDSAEGDRTVRWALPNGDYIETEITQTVSLEGSWSGWKFSFTEYQDTITINNLGEEVKADDTPKESNQEAAEEETEDNL